jgi:hypothetical protein
MRNMPYSGTHRKFFPNNREKFARAITREEFVDRRVSTLGRSILFFQRPFRDRPPGQLIVLSPSRSYRRPYKSGANS